MLNLVKSDKIKNQKHYKIKNIDPGNIVTLSLKKTHQHQGQFWSQEIKVLRKDPTNTGKIIGELVCYWFIKREKTKKKKYYFQ